MKGNNNKNKTLNCLPPPLRGGGWFAVLFFRAATLFIMAHGMCSPCILGIERKCFAFTVCSRHSSSRARRTASLVRRAYIKPNPAPAAGTVTQPRSAVGCASRLTSSGLCSRHSADATPCRAHRPRRAACFAGDCATGSKYIRHYAQSPAAKNIAKTSRPKNAQARS